MTENELAAIVGKAMPEEMYQKSGSLLYTGVNTIQLGKYYVMGINPGGYPAKIQNSIINSLAMPDGQSGYTHDCWNDGCDIESCTHKDQNGRIRDDALHKHQKNYLTIMKALGTDAAKTLSANMIFARSTEFEKLPKETGGISKGDWWDVCWPVHKKLLAVVRPRYIISLGHGYDSSAFGYLQWELAIKDSQPFETEKDKSKMFRARLNLGIRDWLDVTIIGLPHPSWHTISPTTEKRLGDISKL